MQRRGLSGVLYSQINGEGAWRRRLHDIRTTVRAATWCGKLKVGVGVNQVCRSFRLVFVRAQKSALKSVLLK